MIALFFYNSAWTLIFLLGLPVFSVIKSRRFFERVFLKLPAQTPWEKSIWIHALSVGEVTSAIPLVRALRQEYSQKDIVFTVTTRQGMEIARREIGDEVRLLLPMPLDFWWSLGKLIQCIKPTLFVLVETDIWPGLISLLKKRGIKAVLINGRISPRTLRSYKKSRFFIRRLFNSFALCLMQTDLDRKRILSIGVAPENVKTAGNIKFDSDWLPMGDKERHELLKILHLDSQNTVWVAGSTHEGEEEIILDVYKKLLPICPSLLLIIAPRNIERGDAIKTLCSETGFKPQLKTDLTKDGASYDVLILNTLGELGRIYGIGRVSFVGGSLVAQGGHNPLEPAGFGHPVLFGPHMEDFVLMSQLLVESGGGQEVRDSDDLFEALKQILMNPALCDDMGRKAADYVAGNKGALKRVISHLGTYLAQ
jgi:3-deoxy-D-manno-octulosonic-acid transferase